MIQHTLIRFAARARLKTLSVCTTGSTTLEATADGYARVTGSFVTDGFAAGMEVTPDGFTQTATGVITAVSATALTIAGGRTAQASDSGRTLTALLPKHRAWENAEPAVAGVPTSPSAGTPYVVEQYLPGAMAKATLGTVGELEATPLYVVEFHGSINVGADALSRYADATIEHFAPGTTITLANGDVARVRGDVAPSVSPLLTDGDAAMLAVTIPLRLRSANAA